MRRPMDDMVIGADTPQEDEFALLSLGARSPYEALLVPQGLERALALADPARLTPAERQDWDRLFRQFVLAVCAEAPGRVPLLKSPPHACRIPTLLSVFVIHAIRFEELNFTQRSGLEVSTNCNAAHIALVVLVRPEYIKILEAHGPVDEAGLYRP